MTASPTGAPGVPGQPGEVRANDAGGPVQRSTGPIASIEMFAHFWVRHKWMDILVPLIAIGIWVFSTGLGRLPFALTAVPADARRTIYQILASIAVTMGGVTLTSVSLLLTILQIPIGTADHHASAAEKRWIAAAFFAVLPWLAGLFAVAIIGVAIDSSRQGGYGGLQLAVLGLAVGAVCSISRVTWILQRVLSAAADALKVAHPTMPENG